MQRYLEALAVCADEDVDLGKAAVFMAGYLHKNRHLERYIHHLDVLAENVGDRYRLLLSQGAADDAGVCLAALKFGVSEENGYRVLDRYSEVFDGADIIRVIDERAGISGVLALLYARTGIALGWDIAVLRFPDYYVCRLERGGQRFIFDPAEGCKVMAAHDLRALLKARIGASAELSSDYLVPVSRKDFLIQIFNIIKSRQIECSDYDGALETIAVMRLVAPKEIRLWFDCGVLLLKTGDYSAARSELQAFVRVAPEGSDRGEALLLLDEIRYL